MLKKSSPPAVVLPTQSPDFFWEKAFLWRKKFFNSLQFCKLFVLSISNTNNIATNLNNYSEGSEKSSEFQENGLGS
jgi:hypothetical protein